LRAFFILIPQNPAHSELACFNQGIRSFFYITFQEFIDKVMPVKPIIWRKSMARLSTND
jgi:hypothetical protein